MEKKFKKLNLVVMELGVSSIKIYRRM